MIREILASEYNIVEQFIRQDIARNYFLLLGISSKEKVYSNIYGQFKDNKLIAVLFLRRSGVLQFYVRDDFDLEGFVNLIKTLEYNSLIGARSYCDLFLYKGIFNSFDEGAYLSKLDKYDKVSVKENQYNIRSITVDDLDSIINIYRGVFDSFAPKSIMQEKLISKRGRGVCIEIDCEIVSVAQTDFETKDAAVIVGVATDKKYQGLGLATQCMKYLCSTLQSEGKDLYLQYNNLDAESLYNKLGFKKIDRIVHYFRGKY